MPAVIVVIILLVILGSCVSNCGSSSSRESNNAVAAPRQFQLAQEYDHAAKIPKDPIQSAEEGKSVQDFRGETLEVRSAKESIYKKRFEALKEIRRNAFYTRANVKRQEFEAEIRGRIRTEAERRRRIDLERENLQKRLMKLQSVESNKSLVIEDLRTFALKESPTLWETIQTMRAEIQVRDEEIEKYKHAAKEDHREYRTDPEFKRICHLRNLLVKNLRRVQDGLSSAYVLKKEYDAAPTKKELERLMRKALEDGILEAQMAGRRYEELKKMEDGK